LPHSVRTTPVYELLHDARRYPLPHSVWGRQVSRKEVQLDIFRTPRRENMTTSQLAAPDGAVGGGRDGGGEREGSGTRGRVGGSPADPMGSQRGGNYFEGGPEAAAAAGGKEEGRDGPEVKSQGSCGNDIYTSSEDNEESSEADDEGLPIEGTYRWYERQERRLQRRALRKQGGAAADADTYKHIPWQVPSPAEHEGDRDAVPAPTAGEEHKAGEGDDDDSSSVDLPSGFSL